LTGVLAGCAAVPRGFRGGDVAIVFCPTAFTSPRPHGQPSAHQPLQAEVFDREAGVTSNQLRGHLGQEILPLIADGAVYAAKPLDGATAVHTAFAAPITLTVQSADTLRYLPGNLIFGDNTADR